MQSAVPERHDHQHPPRLTAAGAAFLLAAAALLAPACAAGASRSAAPNLPKPDLKPVPGIITGAAVQIDLRPLGSMPTDGVTMPIVSPDGRFVAVQTGVAPDLQTALARPGARPPLASRVALYRVDPRGLVRLGESEGGLVLGRSSDALGVLVESARPDGARWVGRLAWSTLDIEWLVQDGNVNAFAVMGRDGTLVYSSRPIPERRFDLVIRRGGTTRRIPADGVRSFVFPALADDGSRVFAFALRDGVVELAAADPSSDDALKQSLSRTFLTDRGDDQLAMFMSSAQGARDGVEGGDWILYNRGIGSLARWNPTEGLRSIPGGIMARARVDAAREAVLAGGKLRVRKCLPTTEDAQSAAAEPATVVMEQLCVPRALGEVEGKPAILGVIPEGANCRLVLVRFVQ